MKTVAELLWCVVWLVYADSVQVHNSPGVYESGTIRAGAVRIPASTSRVLARQSPFPTCPLAVFPVLNSRPEPHFIFYLLCESITH
jgi:hypothetical protein